MPLDRWANRGLLPLVDPFHYRSVQALGQGIPFAMSGKSMFLEIPYCFAATKKTTKIQHPEGRLRMRFRLPSYDLEVIQPEHT